MLPKWHTNRFKHKYKQQTNFGHHIICINWILPPKPESGKFRALYSVKHMVEWPTTSWYNRSTTWTPCF